MSVAVEEVIHHTAPRSSLKLNGIKQNNEFSFLWKEKKRKEKRCALSA